MVLLLHFLTINCGVCPEKVYNIAFLVCTIKKVLIKSKGVLKCCACWFSDFCLKKRCLTKILVLGVIWLNNVNAFGFSAKPFLDYFYAIVLSTQ